MIAHCIAKLTFHAADFVSIWEAIQKPYYYLFFMAVVHLHSLYKVIHLQSDSQLTGDLEVQNHLLPLLLSH